MSAPTKNSRRWRRSAKRVASPSSTAGFCVPAAFAIAPPCLLDNLAAGRLDDRARTGRDLDAAAAHRHGHFELARRDDLAALGALAHEARGLQRGEVRGLV